MMAGIQSADRLRNPSFKSTLTLLEARILFVDDEQLSLATHDLAICAAFLDGCPDFHNILF
jgi:hypothetical protein